MVVLVLLGLHTSVRLRDGERPAPAILAAVIATGVWVRLDFALFAAVSVVGADSWEWMRYSNRFVLPAGVLLTCLAMRGAELVVGAAGAADRRPVLIVACGLVDTALASVALLDAIDERWARFPTGVVGRPTAWHVAAQLWRAEPTDVSDTVAAGYHRARFDDGVCGRGRAATGRPR